MRIASLNTWKCDGAYFKRIAVMQKQLHAIQADVICLQESFVGGGCDTAMTLANKLEMNLLHFPARHKIRVFGGASMRSSSGLSVLSRYPMTFATAHSLPSFEEDDRWLQHVTIANPHGPINLFNTHLTHVAGEQGMAKRLAQLSLVRKIILDKPNLCSILAGDFNLTIAHEEIRELWDLSRNIQPRTPIDSTLLDQAGRCIDHIFLFDTSDCLSMIDYYAALTEPDEKHGIHASDHHAIVAELKHEPGLRTRQI